MSDVYLSTVQYKTEIKIMEVYDEAEYNDDPLITFNCGAVPVMGYVFFYMRVPLSILYNDECVLGADFVEDDGYNYTLVPTGFHLADVNDEGLKKFIIEQCRLAYTEWLVEN